MPKTPRSRPFLQALGERISECEDRWLRRNRSRSLAAEIGVTDATMSRYRLGKSEPSLETLIKIAKAARVNLDWLASGEGAPDSPTDGQIVLDRRTFVDVSILDRTASRSAEGVWGYIARRCFSNLADIPPDQGPVGGPQLAAFLINEDLQGQSFAQWTWILVDLAVNTPCSGCLCLRGPGGVAYVRELDFDDDGTIEVTWPKNRRPAEVKRYAPAVFQERFAVVGKVLGPLYLP